MSFNDFLYLDSVSSTKVDSEVLETYKYLVSKYYANSGANHKLGFEIKQLEDKSKQQILDLFSLKNYRLIFTSGATEANNMAIKSIAMQYQHLGKHLITSEVEHPSVYNSFKFLESYLGFEVTYLKVDKKGQINLKQLKDSLRAETILVSIMSVNNEIGSIIQPQPWCKLVKKHSKALTHVDMTQALGKIDLNFQNVDLASFSAHKIKGINGSGFLLMRDHLEMIPLISGGFQAENLRAGTSNAPANIVLAKTVRLCLENQKQNKLKIKRLSNYLYRELKTIAGLSFNSDLEDSVDQIINFSVENLESEVMMNALSNKNIFVSAGSTCQSDLAKGSRVLRAISKDKKQQASRIRISLDETLTMSDMRYFIKTIKEIISKYAI